MLGLDATFDAPAPAAEDPSTDLGALYAADREQLAELADQVAAVADQEGLRDYGRFRLAVLAVDSLGIRTEDEAGHHTVAGGRAAGAWSPSSRVLAVGAILRNQGYKVAPQDVDGAAILALPLAEDLKPYNCYVAKAKVSTPRRRGGPVPKEYVFLWLLWDGAQRLGVPTRSGQVLVPLSDLTSAPDRGFALVDRVLPAFTLQNPEPRTFPIHGHEDRVLPWSQHPDARAWLAYYPSLHFQHQVRHAREELASTGIQEGLDGLLALGLPEKELVDTLLRSVQAHIDYQEGPLRDLYDILEDRTGDCDQMCLVMSSLLVAAGWSVEDLRSFQWPGHLALGVRARGETGPAGVFVEVDGQRFHALDPAFINRVDGALVSEWGQLNDRYARLNFTPGRLA